MLFEVSMCITKLAVLSNNNYTKSVFYFVKVRKYTYTNISSEQQVFQKAIQNGQIATEKVKIQISPTTKGARMIIIEDNLQECVFYITIHFFFLLNISHLQFIFYTFVC